VRNSIIENVFKDRACGALKKVQRRGKVWKQKFNFYLKFFRKYLLSYKIMVEFFK